MGNGNRREHTLNMRVTLEEREMIRSLAEDYHMSNTAFLVHLVRREYEKRRRHEQKGLQDDDS